MQFGCFCFSSVYRISPEDLNQGPQTLLLAWQPPLPCGLEVTSWHCGPVGGKPAEKAGAHCLPSCHQPPGLGKLTWCCVSGSKSRHHRLAGCSGQLPPSVEIIAMIQSKLLPLIPPFFAFSGLQSISQKLKQTEAVLPRAPQGWGTQSSWTLCCPEPHPKATVPSWWASPRASHRVVPGTPTFCSQAPPSPGWHTDDPEMLSTGSTLKSKGHLSLTNVACPSPPTRTQIVPESICAATKSCILTLPADRSLS